MKKTMTILAIETSCDETSIALVECTGGLKTPQFKVIKNIVSSQIPIHRPFGGVVPNLAKREHIKNLPLVLRKVLGKARQPNDLRLAISDLPAIDLIAVTVGPGLEPALWTGIEFAKKVTSDMRQVTGKKVPLAGANHLEGHLYSFLANKNPTSYFLHHTSLFPSIALIVSGGHTILLKMDSLTKWKKLGETRDDASGEAFDKVAKMMGLPYPGGPEISKLAEKGNPKAINFPRPMIRDKSYDFSFSGLKTAVLYYLKDKAPSTNNESNTNKRIRTFEKDSLFADFADIAASFEEAVVEVLTKKTMRAVKEFNARSIILCGGVAANKHLKSEMLKATRKMGINFFLPPNDLNGDNAAMIAIGAYINSLKKKKYPLHANGNLNL